MHLIIGFVVIYFLAALPFYLWTKENVEG